MSYVFQFTIGYAIDMMMLIEKWKRANKMLERLLEIFKPISNAIQELRENWNISEEDQQRYQTKRFYLLIYFNLLVIGALTILYILFAYFLSAAVFVHRNMLFYT